MRDPDFSPGFRLSSLDLCVLALGLAGSAAAGIVSCLAGLVVACVVGHFFLFCNVFRVSRPPELAWAAVFMASAGGTILWRVPGWIATAAVTVGATIAVVLVEMRRPSYHGVGWRRINPSLPEWWRSRPPGSGDADPEGARNRSD
ncbi:MAG: hypothetical protein ACYTKD_10195 [Planctomycetota bacterium]|jgi:hypothetical protein